MYLKIIFLTILDCEKKKKNLKNTFLNHFGFQIMY